MMLLLACAAYFALFISPHWYFDDALRVYTHTSINQGVHGRPLADVVYGFLSGGMFMDFSPLSQIWALAFLLLAGVLVTRSFAAFAGVENNFALRWAPLFFTIQPLFYSILAFRFDSLTISLAALCAAGAFYVLALPSRFWAVFFAAIGLWCALCLYQPCVAIFYVCLAAFFSRTSLETGRQGIAGGLLRAFGASILAGFAYLPIYFQAMRNARRPFCGLPLHPYVVEHMRLDSHLGQLWQGVIDFVKTLWSYAGFNMIFGCLCAIFACAILAILFSAVSSMKKLLACAWLCGSLLACGAILIALANSIFPARCMIPLCALALCLLLLAATVGGRRIIRLCGAISLIFMILSASLVSLYANAGRDQDEFEQQVVLQPLWQDIAKCMRGERGKETHGFFVAGSQMPTHFNMRSVNEKYLPLDHPTAAAFVTCA